MTAGTERRPAVAPRGHTNREHGVTRLSPLTRYRPLSPVTGDACRAFVRVRPREALSATGIVATAGDAAGATFTSEGRCPR
ncbi:hypothetical protein Abr02nite_01140 [Paractinoplanes brasiliensis]|nr:hypothetical protein Abr02nite_01140 [Actinoplanes brasiliensis]